MLAQLYFIPGVHELQNTFQLAAGMVGLFIPCTSKCPFIVESVRISVTVWPLEQPCLMPFTAARQLVLAETLQEAVVLHKRQQ